MPSHSPDMPVVTVVAGTRPELVKIAPVVRELTDSTEVSLQFIHSGQHYDDALSASFIDDLCLPDPDVRLGVGSGSHAEQTGEVLTALGPVLAETAPAMTVGVGDTNTVLSTAITASKLPTTFTHVEAGLRSFDRSMPEEVNRVLADHAADVTFAPTLTAADNLADEGITETVHVVGNTVVDVCLRYERLDRSDVAVESVPETGPFVLATIHRPRNTDNPARLTSIIRALENTSVPVILPAHPRTTAAIDTLDLTPADRLRLVDPLDYVTFLTLLDTATVVVTDSGGVQEEAATLETPCLTVRPNTERPETVAAGVNELVEPDTLGDQLSALLIDEAVRSEMTGYPELYGDGEAGRRIAEEIIRRVT